MEHVESRVVLDIDLDILAENYRKIAASVAPLQTVVVLKAGAYGLGMRPVAQALAKAGAAAPWRGREGMSPEYSRHLAEVTILDALERAASFARERAE